MSSPAEEKALLNAAAGTLDRCTGLVSYNGRAFDLPLLNTRFVLNRDFPRLQQAPHLDLLFPARRLLRLRLGSCTLGNVEREALGVFREETDVPGWLIPSIYRRYLRTGDAGELPRVFYHNLEDILSLVTLATHLCSLFAVAGSSASIPDMLHPVDLVSLGRAYERLGWKAASEDAYRRALDDALPPDAREHALNDLGLLLKRQGRREEAAHLWRLWTESASEASLAPFLELAKHHEWHVPDIPAALDWANKAVQRVAAWQPSSRRSLVLSELEHRLNRLQRKMMRGTEA
jgi:hypothetical protein